jgi:hypothetical protein
MDHGENMKMGAMPVDESLRETNDAIHKLAEVIKALQGKLKTISISRERKSVEKIEEPDKIRCTIDAMITQIRIGIREQTAVIMNIIEDLQI